MSRPASASSSARPCPTRHQPYPDIHEYALIGDCHGAALVHACGSIDWACIRRFDAGSVFARLLDEDRGGCFEITPRERCTITRSYLGDTMVLETRFVGPSGEARILDAFAMHVGGAKAPYHQLLRIVEGLRGHVTFEVRIQPRFDYGELRPLLQQHGSRGTFSAIGGDDALVISAPSEITIDEETGAFRGAVTVRAGRRARFSLQWQPAHQIRAHHMPADRIDRRLTATIAWWKRWAKRCSYHGPNERAVLRSALVLKTLTSAPTGSMIAAPTTSLPERLGGKRNYDYRYCWVRDSAFTVAALCAVGHGEVARGYMSFVQHATAGHADDMQIMYGCYGERRLPELELSLNGYRGSRPVRIGNAAAKQRQTDVYGELLNTVYLWTHEGHRISPDEWRFLCSVVEAACEAWKEPDHGFWEMRGRSLHFVHSKVMCWVALDRGLRLAKEQGLDAPKRRWSEQRDAIRADVERRGVDARRGCFVQAYDSRVPDASLLLLPLVGFVGANDRRMIATVRAIEEELLVDGFVRRYPTERVDDGVGGDEGTFLICSFWLVDVYQLQGRSQDARRLFDRLISLGDDLGLFAEEYDPATRCMLGNYPQAFTHVAVINTALTLFGEPRHRVLRRHAAVTASPRRNTAGTHRPAEAAKTPRTRR